MMTDGKHEAWDKLPLADKLEATKKWLAWQPTITDATTAEEVMAFMASVGDPMTIDEARAELVEQAHWRRRQASLDATSRAIDERK